MPGQLARWPLAALLLLGCSQQATVSPEEAVRAFFGAVEANDCKTASQWLDGAAKARFERQSCDEALASLRRKKLDRVLSSGIDGRDAKVHLVRVRFAEEREPAVIAVRETRKGPRLVSF